MKVSIRAKLVSLLVAIAILPLLAALVIIIVGGRSLRRQACGETVLATTSSQATTLGISLTKDIEKIHAVLKHNCQVMEIILADGIKMSARELAELDADWPKLSASTGPLAKTLNNPIAEQLNLIKNEDARISEILITDQFGQLLAATGRTTDFYQADETWWKNTYHQGRGRVFIPPVGYDDSSEVWSVEICLPIIRQRKVVAVVKAVLDLSLWAEGIDKSAEKISAQAAIAGHDGAIIYRKDLEPRQESVQQWLGPITLKDASGWRVTEDRMLQAYSRITLPDKITGYDVAMPSWVLVISIPESKALAPAVRLSLTVALVGITIIVGLFAVGLVLVDRSIARRIRRLRRAAAKITEGDLTYRISPHWAGKRLLGNDELDDLAGDFNRMTERVQHSQDLLHETNQMKTNFIRIASHELRTPVSYMLGMSKLLKDSTDTKRLSYAVQSMGAKALRLDGIIRAMFKLMPDHRYTQKLNYSQVGVSELLEEIYLDCYPFTEKRKQQLLIKVVDNMRPLQADRDKLRDVLENLIMNAIKFTPDGGTVRIDVGIELGGFARFTVIDQGPGISQGDLPHIFNPFFSTSDVMKHSSGNVDYQKRGMGLGLAIVKHFVMLHGGDVRVTTSPTGSTFIVTIPFEPAPLKHRPEKPGN